MNTFDENGEHIDLEPIQIGNYHFHTRAIADMIPIVGKTEAVQVDIPHIRHSLNFAALNDVIDALWDVMDLPMGNRDYIRIEHAWGEDSLPSFPDNEVKENTAWLESRHQFSLWLGEGLLTVPVSEEWLRKTIAANTEYLEAFFARRSKTRQIIASALQIEANDVIIRSYDPSDVEGELRAETIIDVLFAQGESNAGFTRAYHYFDALTEKMENMPEPNYLPYPECDCLEVALFGKLRDFKWD